MDQSKLIEFLKSGNAPAELVSFAEQLKPVSIDSVKEFLEKNDEGKRYLQSYADAQVTKGITTFKEKTMPTLIEQEILKKFPAETEQDKALRQLTERLNNTEKELKRKELHNLTLAKANELGIPVRVAEKLIGEDTDATLSNLQLFTEEWNNGIKSAVEGKFKDNGRTDNGGGTPPAPDTSKMSDEQFFQQQMSKSK